jgi:flavin-dependent dehydrogenase/NAD-dependent dihydropyrimidine dehydrogenase PreA subunit
LELLIDKDKCTGCKVCVKVCPQMVLEVVDKTARCTNTKRCMGCFGCEEECKQQAIRLLRAPQNIEEIEIEVPSEETERLRNCDVAVVGAGPAGLGAAIACAREGLDVLVIEKLPNRQMSHHNDGGIMFTLDGVVSAKHIDDKINFPELDISIDSKVAKKLDFIGFAGPNNSGSRNDFPRNIDGYLQSKVAFLKELARQAEAAGAKIWYDKKVVDILKEGGKVCGIKLHTGEEIRANVVVTADGVFAAMTKKAGFVVSEEDPWFISGIRWQFPLQDQGLPRGYQYLVGDLHPKTEMAPGFNSMQGSIAISDSIHIGIGFLTRKKYHPAPKPLDYYVERFIREDSRVKNLFGDSLAGKKPEMKVGFRGRFRKNYVQDRVLDGAIVVGDAWVDELDLGNLNALANGVHTGRVIVRAARKNDYSKNALNPANDFVGPAIKKYITQSKRDKLASTQLCEEELKLWLEFLPHFHYPALTFGDKKQRQKALFQYVKGNFFNFFKLLKHPNLRPYVLG